MRVAAGKRPLMDSSCMGKRRRENDVSSKANVASAVDAAAERLG